MLRIRLTRTGKTAQETFRVVVAEHSNAVKGKYIELLGHYQPSKNPKEFDFKKERIEYWMSKGAQPSSTIAGLLKNRGFGNMEKFIAIRPNRTKKKGADAAAPAGAPAAAKAPAAEKAPAPEAEAKAPEAEKAAA